MRLEVEQKYRVDTHEKVRSHLEQMGTEVEGLVAQNDTYYAHPVRDFAATDEALRIRRVGQANWFTYKGKKIDQTTKTRHEIDLSIASGEQGATDGAQMLSALGFRPVAQVCKQRENFHVEHAGWDVEVCLDEIQGLGSFVELEIVADESKYVAAKSVLAQVAEKLEISQVERSSYLELLLLSQMPADD